MTDVEIKTILFHLNEIQKILKPTNSNRYIQSTNRQVQCVETGNVYQSVRQAARMHNITPALISFACKDNRKSAGGYHWKYLK